MSRSEFSVLDQEYMILLALQEAMVQTLKRLAMIFAGMEAVTNSGMDNPFMSMIDTYEPIVDMTRDMIANSDNSEKMLAFIKNHQLNLSWSEKE
jgi:hypothetical protein